MHRIDDHHISIFTRDHRSAFKHIYTPTRATITEFKTGFQCAAQKVMLKRPRFQHPCTKIKGHCICLINNQDQESLWAQQLFGLITKCTSNPYKLLWDGRKWESPLFKARPSIEEHTKKSIGVTNPNSFGWLQRFAGQDVIWEYKLWGDFPDYSDHRIVLFVFASKLLA